jgi:hypothetical protein
LRQVEQAVLPFDGAIQMKRYLLAAVFVAKAWAVGTCTVTGPTPIGQTQVYTNSQPFVTTITCVGDASTGSFPATTIPGLLSTAQQLQGFYITRVEIVPGATQPTAGYKVTITDSNGVDELGGNATNLNASGAQIFATGAAATPINGLETLNITGNSVNSANVTVLVFIGSGNSIVGGQVSLYPNSTAATLTSALNVTPGVVEKGARWGIFNQPASGAQATISKAAGAAGVRHVADCVSFSAGAVVAPTAAQLVVNLRDGASGTGTVLWTQEIAANGAAQYATFSICGLNLIGSSATAMTLEFSALLASVAQSVSLSGYDVE